MDLCVLMLPFILSTILMSNTISIFVGGRKEPVIVLFFTSVLFIFLMGVSWLWHSLVYFWGFVFSLLPSSAAERGFIALSSMVADINQVKNEYVNLWIFTVIYMFIASIGQRFLIFNYKKSMVKEEKDSLTN